MIFPLPSFGILNMHLALLMYCWEMMGFSEVEKRVIWCILLFLLSTGCADTVISVYHWLYWLYTDTDGISICTVSAHDSIKSFIHTVQPALPKVIFMQTAGSKANFFFFAKIFLETKLNEFPICLHHFISFASKQSRMTLGDVCTGKKKKNTKNPWHFRQWLVSSGNHEAL